MVNITQEKNLIRANSVTKHLQRFLKTFDKKPLQNTGQAEPIQGVHCQATYSRGVMGLVLTASSRRQILLRRKALYLQKVSQSIYYDFSKTFDQETTPECWPSLFLPKF